MESSDAGKELRTQGQLWAQHVLEGPVTWLMLAVYICVTVTIRWTPLSAIAYGISNAAGYENKSAVMSWWDYLVGAADSVIYLFLPWWTAVLLRLLRGRPWLHRVAGRSLLIGDVPWVAQSLEQFVSKLFALSYSIASLNVA